VELGATPPTTLGNYLFQSTMGSAAPSRTITIKFPAGSGVLATWVSTNNGHWGLTLPTGGIAQGTY
jgi:hypothetical protein